MSDWEVSYAIAERNQLTPLKLKCEIAVNNINC